MRPAKGPATTRARSRTRRPSSGWVTRPFWLSAQAPDPEAAAAEERALGRGRLPHVDAAAVDVAAGVGGYPFAVSLHIEAGAERDHTRVDGDHVLPDGTPRRGGSPQRVARGLEEAEVDPSLACGQPVAGAGGPAGDVDHCCPDRGTVVDRVAEGV